MFELRRRVRQSLSAAVAGTGSLRPPRFYITLWDVALQEMAQIGDSRQARARLATVIPVMQKGVGAMLRKAMVTGPTTGGPDAARALVGRSQAPMAPVSMQIAR